MTAKYWNLEETLTWESEDCKYPDCFTAKGEFIRYTLSSKIVDGEQKHWHVRVRDYKDSPEWTYPMSFANANSAKWFCEYHNILSTHLDKWETK